MSHTSKLPPPEAIEQFLSSSTRHTRRVEIYEQDAVTRWAKDTEIRLKGGSVSVDGSRDERRALDLVLDNTDGVLLNAPGELWYDKIIKVFRGVSVNGSTRLPKILIISDKTAGEAMAGSFRAAMVNQAFGDVQVNTLVTDYSMMKDFDIIVGLSGATSPQITALTQAYRSGKSVLLLDVDAVAWANATFSGEVGTSTSQTSGTTAVAPSLSTPNPVAQGWSSFTLTVTGSTTTYVVTEDSATVVGSTGSTSRIYTFVDPSTDGRAVMVNGLINNAQFAQTGFVDMLGSAVSWLNPVQHVAEWETQIGEFMIDRISEPHFPHEVKITGRDYTKKCMTSKFVTATQFDPGYALESLIAAIASNAGIIKRQFPVTGITVGKQFYFDRGVSRWEAMKQIATAYNYDLYFDAYGYLVLTPFHDPATEAPALYIHTGVDGQIASYEKSTSDARIYNHVVVTGESSDSSIPPVWAEAVNDDPDSPTSRSEIGDRLYQYTSSFIVTTQQAQDVADKFLAIHALEEFELSFETLMLPWLDVNSVIGWIDPSPAPGDPTVFLLTQLNYPLSLGPMGGTARRVTNVVA